MGKITTAQIAETIAASKGSTKSAIKDGMEAIFGEIAEQLAAGNEVSIAGFGTFKPRHNAARKGRNPSTGAEIDIAASVSAAFKQAKALKDALN